MLGANCSVDVDFLPDDKGGNCAGLREAFTPKIDFSCCRKRAMLMLSCLHTYSQPV
ncbi:hypothetical protein E2C01_051322 [Portunus trituberculatus]|uniref:Uncharacterized protein n=1 Tax=Portunus trituberculatus TaxID=210409 RepID=A0A5B7GLH3_PORTR|nr:hypothetical protein [Portunus trituberculatus]